jgi:hypothetical protein
MLGEENLSFLEKANLTLAAAGLSTTVVSFHQLRYVAPVIFIKIFQNFFSVELNDLILDPKNKDDHIRNANILMNALRSSSSSSYSPSSSVLLNVTGASIVSGDRYTIESLVNYFYSLYLQISKDGNCHLDLFPSSTTPHPAVNLSVTKHSQIFLSSNLSFDQKTITTTTTNSTAPLTPPPPVAGANVQQMSPTSIRANETTSEESLRLRKSFNPEYNDEGGDGGDPQRRNRKQRKSRKKTQSLADKATLSKRSFSRLPTRPLTPSRLRPSHLLSRTYPSASHPPHDTPFIRHSSTSPSASPVDTALTTPSPSSPAQVGDLPHYDLLTGHKIPALEMESQRLERKERYLSLGIILTDSGELRDRDTLEPVSIAQIQAAREKDRLLQQERQQQQQQGQGQGTERSSYPGENTKQSVERYLERRMRELQEELEYGGRAGGATIVAFGSTAERAAAAGGGSGGTRPMDDENQFSSRTRLFPCYRHLTSFDLVLSVEYCHDCQDHHPSYPSCTNSSEGDYEKYADDVLRYLSAYIHSLSPSSRIRLGVVRFPSKHSYPHCPPSLHLSHHAAAGASPSSSSICCPSESLSGGGGGGAHSPPPSLREVEKSERIGALEVQIGFKNEHQELCADLLYSKLNTHQWPSKTVLLKRLQRFLSLHHISTPFPPSLLLPSTSPSPQPIPWNSLPISSPSWTFTPPSPQGRAARRGQQKGPFVWCFDYRLPYSGSRGEGGRGQQQQQQLQVFESGMEVKIRDCPNPWGGVEHYTTLGVIKEIFEDTQSESDDSSRNRERLLRVEIPAWDNHHLTVPEKLCSSAYLSLMTDPPLSFETINTIPVPLSIVIQYALDNDLPHRWSPFSDDDLAETSPSPSLLLTRQSFLLQVGSLVWQCISSSPGKRRGMMSYKGMDLSVQLAYSPSVLDHVLKLYKGIGVEMRKLIKTIRPKMKREEIVDLFDLEQTHREDEDGDEEEEELDEERPEEEQEHRQEESKMTNKQELSAQQQQQQQQQQRRTPLSPSQSDITFASSTLSPRIATGLDVSEISQRSEAHHLDLLDTHGHAQGRKEIVMVATTGGGGEGEEKIGEITNTKAGSDQQLDHSMSYEFPDLLQTLFSEEEESSVV